MRALCPAIRTSDASASAKPPPLAAPCTSEMIGCGARRMRITISAIRRCARMPSAGPPTLAPGELLLLACSFRSSPAQKARPAPFRTTIRTE